MLRFGTFLAVAVALSAAASLDAGVSNSILELDLSPEEAQKYLNSPPFTEPQLSGRRVVLPLVRYDDPSFRSAEAGPTRGHYWRNGQEIENPDAYVEEVYDASQYHGQDGLGAYVYGYETPESSKVENRVRSGDVTGSYTFRGANDELIKVRYWSDSEGFHQEDNIPKVVLQPVEEAEDVREARLAHEKAWQEAAAAARLNPDPLGEYYNKQNDYQPAASELDGVVVAPDGQAPEKKAPEVKAPEEKAPEVKAPEVKAPEVKAPEVKAPEVQAREGKALEVQAREGKAYNRPQTQFPSYPSSPKPEQYEEPEPTGPPRGFFYKFTYPVSIIVPKNPEEQIPSSYGKGVPPKVNY